jgi:hypothetical protein
MKKLGERWGSFVYIILDPWVIILLALTIILTITLSNQDDNFIIIILTVIISLASGVLPLPGPMYAPYRKSHNVHPSSHHARWL